jgi:hypothetical protein
MQNCIAHQIFLSYKVRRILKSWQRWQLRSGYLRWPLLIAMVYTESCVLQKQREQ